MTESEPSGGARAFVTAWLADRYGSVEGPIEHEGHVTWWVSRGERESGFDVRVTTAALAQSPEWLGRQLHRIAGDVPPKLPGFFHVSTEGVSVRGMDEIRFLLYGQEVRCWLRSREPGSVGASGTADPVWSVEVDGVDHGGFSDAIEGAARASVARMAIRHLRDRKALRVPDEGWEWSVLAADGREWWGRVQSSDPGSGRVLVFRRVADGREHRIEWGELPIPRPAEMGKLLPA